MSILNNAKGREQLSSMSRTRSDHLRDVHTIQSRKFCDIALSSVHCSLPGEDFSGNDTWRTDCAVVVIMNSCRVMTVGLGHLEMLDRSKFNSHYTPFPL